LLKTPAKPPVLTEPTTTIAKIISWLKTAIEEAMMVAYGYFAATPKLPIPPRIKSMMQTVLASSAAGVIGSGVPAGFAR